MIPPIDASDRDPPAAAAELDALLAPRSIVLLGASSDERKFSGRPVRALKRHGFAGDLWIVNPRRDEIQGVPCVPTVEDLPDGIDLAVAMIGADASVDALEACGRRGIKGAVVMAGGFAEAGPEGLARQERLDAIAATYGMRYLGPNTPGFVNVDARVAVSASAWAQRDDLPSGPISIVTQSGAIGGVLADRVLGLGVGLRSVIFTGNEANVGVADALDWLVRDAGTTVAMLFLEGLGHDTRVARALQRARLAGVGVVVAKAGASEAGRLTIESHTGNVVGDDGAFDAMCASLGIVRARDYAELVEGAQLLARRPRLGRRLAVVGSSGGMNGLFADAAATLGMSLPALSDETVAKIATLTPDFGSSLNPVDISSVMLVEPERLGRAVEYLGQDPRIDTVVVPMNGHPADLSERIARTLLDGAANTGVPVVVQWSAGPQSTTGIVAAAAGGLSVITEPGRCAWALDQVLRASERELARPAADVTVSAPLATPTESEAKALLAEISVAVPERRVLTTADGAGVAIAELGGRAVVKADCVGAVHKSDVGALRIGVTEGEAVTAANAVLAAARRAFGDGIARGLLIERQVEPGVELVVAGHVDPQVGPVITVGAGGTLVEILRDTCSRLAPVGEAEAAEMLAGLRIVPLLAGHRGAAPVDGDALAVVVSRVSHAIAAWQADVALIELNPVVASPDGAVALDAVITLTKEA